MTLLVFTENYYVCQLFSAGLILLSSSVRLLISLSKLIFFIGIFVYVSLILPVTALEDVGRGRILGP